MRKHSKRIELQRARRAELEELLALDESTLALVHETCKATIKAELRSLEARHQQTIAAHARAVARLENIESE